MKTIGPVEAGGFYLENGLPDDYYAFTDGELSLTVERGGGINTLAVLDILEHKGRLYPDRTYTPPIFMREGNQCGQRPLFGPAVQFISTSRRPDGRPGRNLHHFPERTELYPFGFRSESHRFGHRLGYDLCIDKRAVFCRFANAFPDRDRLQVSINKDHVPSGELTDPWCLKTQFAAESLPPDFGADAECADAIPKTGRLTLTWHFIGFDAGSDVFVMEGEMRMAYGTRGVVVVMAGSRPITFSETKTRRVLSLPWTPDAAEDELRVALVVGESRADAVRQARRLCANGHVTLRRQVDEAVGQALRAPRLTIEGCPAAAEYARTMPAFEHAMVLAETGTEACIRAAMHKFGYFAAWDQLYPVRAFLAMGDHDTARKLLRYHITMPFAEAFHVQAIPGTEEAIAFTDDGAFLAEVYPRFRRFFLAMAAGVDSRTGLMRSRNSFGADFPRELGIEGLVWAPCVNGWWFNGCRAMENFALRLGDAEGAAAARSVGDRVAAHFMSVFFDERRGYLRSAVGAADGKGASVYQNVSTMAMDYPYGEYLLHTRLREIAEYQAGALCHANGRSAVAHDDEAHEMWKSVLMFQHIAHETKTARAAGLGGEALRLVKNYLRLFDRFKVGIETQNLCGCDGDSSQRANWQAFACIYEALIEGAIGIQWDAGGFGYAPCPMAGEMTLENFRFRGQHWDIRVRGAGPYVSTFAVDGQRLLGTTRLTAEWVDGKDGRTLDIVRGDRPFARPTLLSAPGAAVVDLESAPASLSFSVATAVHAPVKAFCPCRPAVTVQGAAVPCEWDGATGLVWCDVVLQPGERLSMGT